MQQEKVYIIMELCQGGELFDRIAECGGLPEDEARRYFVHILSALRQAMGSWAAVVYHLKHSLSKSSVIAEQRATLRIWRWRMLDRKKARLQFNSMVKYATTRWMQWALYQPFSRWRYKLMVRRERTVRQEEVSPTSRDRGNRRGSVPASFKAHSPSPAAHTLRGVPDNIRVRLPPPSPP